MNAVVIFPVTLADEDASKAGCAAIYSVGLVAITLHSVVICRCTGAVHGSVACDRIDDLVAVAMKELKCWPEGPKLILGDMDEEIDDFQHIKRIIKEEGWVDFGVQAHMRGGKSNEATCHTNAKARRQEEI